MIGPPREVVDDVLLGDYAVPMGLQAAINANYAAAKFAEITGSVTFTTTNVKH